MQRASREKVAFREAIPLLLHIISKGRRPVKVRFLKTLVLLVVVVIAVGLYLRIGNPPLQRKNSTGTLLKAHDGPVPADPHEKEMLTMALKKNPKHGPVLLKLAEIESEEGHLQEAAGHLRKILDSEPGNPDANLELGKVLFQLGDIRGAIEHTERILQSNPTHQDALYNMGAIYANIGNQKDAKIYWNRLAGLNPNSPNAQKAQLMLNRLEAINP
jgi:Flp pilus assembly protein TadD